MKYSYSSFILYPIAHTSYQNIALFNCWLLIQPDFKSSIFHLEIVKNFHLKRKTAAFIHLSLHFKDWTNLKSLTFRMIFLSALLLCVGCAIFRKKTRKRKLWSFYNGHCEIWSTHLSIIFNHIIEFTIKTLICSCLLVQFGVANETFVRISIS